jgi:PAS domain-containing protein
MFEPGFWRNGWLRDALPLRHSWSLDEQPKNFEFGVVLNAAAIDAVEPVNIGDIGLQHAGCWECDLTDNSLIWSGGVYDIFGLPRGTNATREAAVSMYAWHSRAKMEALRAHAIKHKRGFTLDIEVRPATGEERWVRLITAPVVEGGKVVRLHGLKIAL